MGWRFRKSFSPIPGVRLTFSPRGISTSVGAGPLRFTVGPQGPAVTARIPGTGIAFRERIHLPGSESGSPSDKPQTTPADVPTVPVATEIRSASTATLTSEGLGAIKELLVRAQEERSRLLPELHEAEADAARLRARHERWTKGWLFRRLFKKHFARLGERSTEATAKEAELREQESLSRLSTEFDLPVQLKDAFGHLCDATSTLSQSQRIWDTISTRDTDRYHERTVARQSIERKPVVFSLGACDLIQSAWKVPYLTNANGGELLIYPGFILYHVSNEAFALVDIHETTIEYRPNSFIEEESVPADSQLIGHTWKKANKDGSPDRRFNNNYQIPIVAYGTIRITSKTGLNEEYLISKPNASQAFAEAFALFSETLPKAAPPDNLSGHLPQDSGEHGAPGAEIAPGGGR